MQRARAAQVGLLMRSYRESFSPGGGRRGLTKEALLERMGSVDGDYSERYSDATVSRWESGGTRPTLQRLKVFGKALDLSRTEVAGLILLAGLATDFRAALGQVTGSDGDRAIGNGPTPEPRSASYVAASTESYEDRKHDVHPQDRNLFLVLEGPAARDVHSWRVCAFVLRLEQCLDAHSVCLFRNWNRTGAGIPATGPCAPFREFFWVSLFFLLTTPLLQFASTRVDHYNFHTIGNIAGTQMPYMLALLLNLVIAAAAGLMFQLLWKRQYSGDSNGSSALRRAASVALPPVISVYAVVVVITNTSVSIQLAVLMPVLAAVFTALLVLRDSAFNPSERDRLFLLSTASVLTMISATLWIVTMMAIYLSPDLPRVLPDHNLLRSWEIDFAELGLSREEVLDGLNLGYMWHAIWVFAFMFFVVGGRLIVSIYRIDGGQRR